MAANFFWIGPHARAAMGEMWGNTIFVLVRSIVILGLAFVLVWALGKRRFQALGAVAALELVDHAVFRLIWLRQQSGSPEWDGVIMGLMMSFMVAFPMVVLLAFAGAELGRAVSQRRS